MNGEEVQDLLRCVFDVLVMETSDVTGLSHKAIEKKTVVGVSNIVLVLTECSKKKSFSFGGKVNTDSLFTPQTGIE